MYDKSLLIVSIILHLLSIALFLKKRFSFAVLTLLLASLALHFWASSLFPYLHDWDERYHALVAKNLSHHMLFPTLFEHPALPIVENDWSQAHVWLHKQPLFLWQMAISVKLFGANETAVRLPSILLCSLLVVVIYRIGFLVFDRETGYMAAFLVASSFNITELTCGEMGMDHNDISFMFYITASIWSWIEYERSSRMKWIFLMGLFAGAAVLCKWLTGLLVFQIFGFSHLIIQKDFFTKKSMSAFGLSLLICALTTLPWQIYILCHFPKEAAFEYWYNNIHFIRAVEGHSEGTWFYLDALKYHYHLLQIFIFIGFGVALYRNSKLKFSLPLIIGVSSVYLFFTLAQTKLQNYVFMVMPLMYLFLGAGLMLVFKVALRLLPYWLYVSLVLFFMSVIFIRNANIPELVVNIVNKESYYGKIDSVKRVNTAAFIAARKVLPESYTILDFNTGDEIECMFYMDNMVYSRITEDKIYQLKLKKLPIATFQSDNVPDFILADSSIQKLPFKLIAR